MKKRVYSPAGLFLIELMISILFFAITASIFLQVFVKSENIRKESKELFKAQENVASIAEYVRGNPEYITLLKEEYPDAVIAENKIYIFYNVEWKACTEKEAVYQIELTSEQMDDMEYINIAALKKEKNIYQIELKKYRAL